MPLTTCLVPCACPLLQIVADNLWAEYPPEPPGEEELEELARQEAAIKSAAVGAPRSYCALLRLAS